MNRCGEHSSWIDLYLDDELGEDELEVFNRHITECPSCRVMLAERRRFLEQVRAARPLHRASPQFRAQMAALLSAVPARQREMTAVKVQQGGRSWPSWLWTEAIPALIICSLSIAGIMILWNFSMREARANALGENSSPATGRRASAASEDQFPSRDERLVRF
jgi:anti-sigma factor RsiW